MAQEVIEEVVSEEVQTEDVLFELPELTLDELKEKITIKQRMGVIAKQEVINTVYNSCVKKDEQNGIYYIDSIMLQVAYDLAMLGNCTDFYTVVENAAAYNYDDLNEIGIFDYVDTVVNIEDISDIDNAIEGFSNRVADLNGIGSFMYRILGDFTKKTADIDFNKLLKDIPKAINGIDKDVIAIVAKELGNGQLGKILNGKKVTNITDIKK